MENKKNILNEKKINDAQLENVIGGANVFGALAETMGEAIQRAASNLAKPMSPIDPRYAKIEIRTKPV